MVTEALRRANDTKALEFGVGAIEKTGKMFKELFPSSKAVVVADRNTWKELAACPGRPAPDPGRGVPSLPECPCFSGRACA